MRGDGGGWGVAGYQPVSMYICAHHKWYGARTNFGDLPPIFNLWWPPYLHRLRHRRLVRVYRRQPVDPHRHRRWVCRIRQAGPPSSQQGESAEGGQQALQHYYKIIFEQFFSNFYFLFFINFIIMVENSRSVNKKNIFTHDWMKYFTFFRV